MNFVDTICTELIKPEGAERTLFLMTVDFDRIHWYTETEDILKGEATNLIKFSTGCFVFLSVMPIAQFEANLNNRK